jgi:hypothetical protein
VRPPLLKEWEDKTMFLPHHFCLAKHYKELKVEQGSINKEWSFQDGGLYIIKKVGVKILTIIVLYRLSY